MINADGYPCQPTADHAEQTTLRSVRMNDFWTEAMQPPPNPEKRREILKRGQASRHLYGLDLYTFFL